RYGPATGSCCAATASPTSSKTMRSTRCWCAAPTRRTAPLAWSARRSTPERPTTSPLWWPTYGWTLRRPVEQQLTDSNNTEPNRDVQHGYGEHGHWCAAARRDAGGEEGEPQDQETDDRPAGRDEPTRGVPRQGEHVQSHPDPPRHRLAPGRAGRASALFVHEFIVPPVRRRGTGPSVEDGGR